MPLPFQLSNAFSFFNLVHSPANLIFVAAAAAWCFGSSKGKA
jgi:hypothetical protein